MTKQKILLLIPLAIIAGLLIYSWATILLTDITATWQHYVALGLFVGLICLYFKSFNRAILATGLYLLMATCNAFSMTPAISTSWFQIGSIETPHFQLLS